MLLTYRTYYLIRNSPEDLEFAARARFGVYADTRIRVKYDVFVSTPLLRVKP
jgi:hypothetical protein